MSIILRFYEFHFAFTNIDPYLKNFLTYHPTFYTPIDRSRRALQLCRGGRGEWVKFRLRFWSIKYFALRERPVRRSHLLRSYRRSWPNFAHISKTFSRKYPEKFKKMVQKWVSKNLGSENFQKW